MAASTEVQIQVSTDGHVPPGTADYARAKIRAVLRLTHRPVLAARVRVTRHGDPVVQHPVVAQANLDFSGRLVRARAEGATAQEAIDRLEDRLRHRVERIAQHWEARRGGMPSTEPHEWRHESEHAHRHHWYPRPAQEREIVRHKSFTLHRCTIDDAAREMEMLGYDFHLFTESGTGQDAR
ncbi:MULTISPECIES: HPF/RaiA family ribosome-associated protein [Kribbella]|nr:MULTISPECIES: HPF/RaiA family ribosome-associated protein [Kribbella]